MTAPVTRLLDLAAVGGWTIFDHIFRISRIPEPGGTVTITSPIEEITHTYWGGCAPNNTVAAARLGFRAGLVMVAGRDFDELGYRQYLEQAGVDLRGVQVVPDGSSGRSFLFSDPGGDSICISHIGVAERQEESEPNGTVLRDSRAVLLNYRFDRFTLAAGEAARRSGALVATSGALDTSLMPEKFVAVADVLIGSRFELDSLAKLLGLGDISALLSLGPRAILMTEGHRGSRVLTREGEETVPAVKARAVVDPTGAGDAFAGATVAALARGALLSVAVRIGATTASFVVEARGCQTNLPTWDAMSQRYRLTFGAPPPPLIN